MTRRCLIVAILVAVGLMSCARAPRVGRTSVSAGQPRPAAPQCPLRTLDEYYFPVGALEPHNAESDAFRRRWYSSHLRTMDEPSLSCGPDSREAYRFLWLRTFHRPIAVRVAAHGDTVTLTLVELDGAGGYAPGKIANRLEKELSREDWSTLQKLLSAIRLWDMPTISSDDDLHTDGSQWIVESRKQGICHVVDRFRPRPGSYRDLGLWFLKTAGVSVAGQELY